MAVHNVSDWADFKPFFNYQKKLKPLSYRNENPLYCLKLNKLDETSMEIFSSITIPYRFNKFKLTRLESTKKSPTFQKASSQYSVVIHKKSNISSEPRKKEAQEISHSFIYDRPLLTPIQPIKIKEPQRFLFPPKEIPKKASSSLLPPKLIKKPISVLVDPFSPIPQLSIKIKEIPPPIELDSLEQKTLSPFEKLNLLSDIGEAAIHKKAEKIIHTILENFDEVEGELHTKTPPSHKTGITLKTLRKIIKLGLMQKKESIEIYKGKDEPNILIKRDRHTFNIFTMIQLAQGQYGVVHKAFDLLNAQHFITKIAKDFDVAKKDLANEVTILKYLNTGADGQLQHIQSAPIEVFNLYPDLEEKNVSHLVGYIGRFYPGESLDKQSFNQLIPQKKLKMTEQILNAGVYLANKGVIHGDIKPANILIDENGCCCLGDFGTAVMITDDESLQSTIKGSPYYIFGGSFEEYMFQLEVLKKTFVEALRLPPSIEKEAAMTKARNTLQKFQEGRDVYAIGTLIKKLFKTKENAVDGFDELLNVMTAADFTNRPTLAAAMLLFGAIKCKIGIKSDDPFL